MSSTPVAINYFHAAAVAPILGYIAYENYSGRALSQNLSIIIAIIAIFVIIYHLHIAMKKTSQVAAEGYSSGVVKKIKSLMT